MSDTPLYDATLSDLLRDARRSVELAELRVRAAEERARQAQHEAARVVAEAHARADRAVREERFRRTLLVEEAEERVRRELADVPALPSLREPVEAAEAPEAETPPVPSMIDLLQPSPGVTRFLDALLGPSEP